MSTITRDGSPLDAPEPERCKSDPLPYAVPARALAAALPAFLLDYAWARLAVSMLGQIADETDALRARIATLEARLVAVQTLASETEANHFHQGSLAPWWIRKIRELLAEPVGRGS